MPSTVIPNINMKFKLDHEQLRMLKLFFHCYSCVENRHRQIFNAKNMYGKKTNYSKVSRQERGVRGEGVYNAVGDGDEIRQLISVSS